MRVPHSIGVAHAGIRRNEATAQVKTAHAVSLVFDSPWPEALQWFRFEGSARALLVLGEGCNTGCWAIKEAHGIGECLGIGDGPGVHCVINGKRPVWAP